MVKTGHRPICMDIGFVMDKRTLVSSYHKVISHITKLLCLVKNFKICLQLSGSQKQMVSVEESCQLKMGKTDHSVISTDE